MGDCKTWWLDADNAIPKIGNLPAAANSVYEGGRLAWSDASGNAIPSSAVTASSKCWGFWLTHIDNSTATPGPGNSGLAGGVPGGIPYGIGVALLTGDGSVSEANVGAYVYLVSDSGGAGVKPVVGLSDAGGTRPLVGFVWPYVRTSSDVDPSAIPVAIGFARPDAFDPELASSFASAYTSRAVATSIAAYGGTGTGVLTETGTSAIGAQDGVTLAVNDLLFLPHGLSNVQAADVGPWVVTALGGSGAHWKLTRPDWWVHGAAIPTVAIIRIGPEGTKYFNTNWRNTVTGTIDTTDPLFYPERLHGTGAVGTQVTGLYAVSGASVSAVDATAAAAVKAVLSAGNGTGTLDFTGTGTDVISWVVTNF